MVWTADQIIKLVGEVGGIGGSVAIIVQCLHNNKTIITNAQNNAHQTVMNATSGQSQSSPTSPVSGSVIHEPITTLKDN